MKIKKSDTTIPPQTFPSVLLGLFLIVLVLVYPFFETNENGLVLLSCSCLLIIYLFTYVFSTEINLNLKTNDLAVLIYLLYNMILVMLSERPVDPVCWFEWCGMILLYIIVRRITGTSAALLAIIVSVLIQSFYGLGQQCGLFFSNHSHFP